MIADGGCASGLSRTRARGARARRDGQDSKDNEAD